MRELGDRMIKKAILRTSGEIVQCFCLSCGCFDIGKHAIDLKSAEKLEADVIKFDISPYS